jgi:hypothetical protein
MRERSPIEMMVDKACGYDPSKDTAPAKEPLADESAALLAVADAAVAWQKVMMPFFNSDEEKTLYFAVEKLIKLGWKL